MARTRKWTALVAILVWLIAGLTESATWLGAGFLLAWLLMIGYLALFGYEMREEWIIPGLTHSEMPPEAIGFLLGVTVRKGKRLVKVRIKLDWRDWLGVTVAPIVAVALVEGINPVVLLCEVGRLVSK